MRREWRRERGKDEGRGVREDRAFERGRELGEDDGSSEAGWVERGEK